MKHINKMIYKLKMIYKNIKYILCDEIINYDDIIDNINVSIDNAQDDIKELENDVNGKICEYDVEDIIHNQVGSVDDFITYDDLNIEDVLKCQDDVKVLKDKIHDNINDNNDNNDSIDSLIERDLLISEVIKTIINKLEDNENV